MGSLNDNWWSAMECVLCSNRIWVLDWALACWKAFFIRCSLSWARFSFCSLASCCLAASWIRRWFSTETSINWPSLATAASAARREAVAESDAVLSLFQSAATFEMAFLEADDFLLWFWLVAFSPCLPRCPSVARPLSTGFFSLIFAPISFLLPLLSISFVSKFPLASCHVPVTLNHGSSS